MNNIFKFFFKKKKNEIVESDVEVFEKGYEQFHKDGKYNESAYYSMINMFCKTDGQFLLDKHNEIARNSPRKRISDNVDGVLGSLNKVEFDSFNQKLNSEGYVIFNKKIDPNIIERIKKFAIETPAYIVPVNNDGPMIYDETNLKSEKYYFNDNQLANNVDIQKLIMDPTLINIARNYLECEPIFDFPAMWWSTSYLKTPSTHAAQQFHFDLDRLKWLKIFILISDVTEETSPHFYIKGTHIPGNKPKSLLDRGYSRISDEDIESHYKKDDIVMITGKSGTVFAGDTKCWHKGSVVKSGHRLLLEFQYSSSLFGAECSSEYNVNNYTPEFKEFCQNNPYYSQKIKF